MNSQSVKSTEIKINGVTLTVCYYYEPGEEAVPYYKDGSGYPGSPPVASIEAISAIDSEVDIYDLLSVEMIRHIEEKIIEQENNN